MTGCWCFLGVFPVNLFKRTERGKGREGGCLYRCWVGGGGKLARRDGLHVTPGAVEADPFD